MLTDRSFRFHLPVEGLRYIRRVDRSKLGVKNEKLDFPAKNAVLPRQAGATDQMRKILAK